MDEIKLKSRYGDIHKLVKISDKDYRLELSNEYCRVGIIEDNPDNYSFIDPSGGPFIEKGSKINGLKVNKIKKSNPGFIIEFE